MNISFSSIFEKPAITSRLCEIRWFCGGAPHLPAYKGSVALNYGRGMPRTITLNGEKLNGREVSRALIALGYPSLGKLRRRDHRHYMQGRALGRKLASEEGEE